MTIHQFNLLNEHEQCHNLLMKGICIADRATPENQILLFQLNEFYIEVFLDVFSNEVTQVRMFDDLGELQPYLEKVNITHVI